MAIHPGNYVTHFIEETRSDDAGLADTNPIKGCFEPFIEMLEKDTIPFVLSEAHIPLIWNTLPKGDVLDGVRLPYDKCVIEWSPPESFHSQELKNDPYFDAGPRRIVLAEHILLQGAAGIKISAVWWSELMEHWTVGSYGVFIPEALFHNLGEFITDQGLTIDTAPPSIDPSTWIIPTAVPVYLNDQPLDEFFDKVHQLGPQLALSCVNDIVDEIRITLGFMAVLSCESIQIGQVDAPAKLNAKRARHGKRPYSAYKYINIKLDKQKYSDSGDEPGYHVKTHYRRGHVRRLHESNTRIWVRPTVVNPDMGDAPRPRYKV